MLGSFSIRRLQHFTASVIAPVVSVFFPLLERKDLSWLFALSLPLASWQVADYQMKLITLCLFQRVYHHPTHLNFSVGLFDDDGSTACSVCADSLDFTSGNSWLNQFPKFLSSWNLFIPDAAFIVIAAALHIEIKFLFELYCVDIADLCLHIPF